MTGPTRRSQVGPTRRSHVAGGRPHTVKVTFSDLEKAMVLSAARRAGTAEAAWLAEVAVKAAAATTEHSTAGAGQDALLRELMKQRGELMETRRVLRNVGGNLNDVARVANATGRVAAETTQVQELVARVVARVDAAVREVDAGLRAALRRIGGRR